jgi:sulfur-oxidizing protein SoxB
MNLTKREFLQVLAAASAAGMGLGRFAERRRQPPPPRAVRPAAKFGNVSFLHMTDCHAQLKPIYFREPSVNLGWATCRARLPHLVGEHLLKAAGIKPGTPRRMPDTYLDFEKAARATARWAALRTWPRWSSA